MDINPITGKPITDPKKPTKPGSTVAAQNGSTVTVGNTIPFRGSGLSNLNPLTGKAYSVPKSNLIYSGVNAASIDFSQDLTSKEGQGSAERAIKDGIDISLSDNWEDQRARNQGWAPKVASAFLNKIALTAISTAGEAFFGSVTGAAYSAITGFSAANVEKDKQLRAYMASYMEKDGRYAMNPDMLNQSDSDALGGISSILQIVGRMGTSQTTAPYDEEAIKQGIIDEIWGTATPNLFTQDANGKEELQKQLAAQGITKDNIFEALAEERDIQNSVLGIRPSSIFGATGYNAPGTIGASQMLGKYQKAVEEATRKYVYGSPDGNYMRDIAASYWDTPLGNAMDALREWGDKVLPYRYTEEERELAAKSVNWVPFTDGSFNFYFDKVASGVGFAAGAFAPAYLTKGKGAGSVGYRMGKNLYGRVTGKPNVTAAASSLEAEAAATQGIRSGEGAAEMAARLRDPSKLERFKNNFRDYQRLVSSSYLASYAESAVESRDVKRQFIEQETAKWLAENPGKTAADIPSDIQVRIEMMANSAGNTNFAMQMPMLMATNMFTLGSIMKFKAIAPIAQRFGVTAEEGVRAARLTGEAGKVTEKFWFNTKAGRMFEKSVKGVGRIAPAAASEGAQEGFQYFAQKYSLGYYADRIVDDEVHLGQNYAEALNKTLNDTESIEQMVIGAMIGGGMSAIANRAQSKANKKATETVKSIMNSGVLSNIIQRAEMSAESKAIMKDYSEKVKSGDTNGARDALFKLIASEASIAEQFGSKDLYNEMLDDLAQMSPEDFAKFAMPEASDEFKNNLTQDSVREIAADVKAKFNRAAEIRKGIVERFPLPQRSSGVDRLGMSQRQIDDEELRIKAMSTYRDILYSTAIDVEGADGSIQAIIEDLQKIVPGLDIDILKMKVKAGDVKAAEDGKPVTMDNIQAVMGTAVDKKTQEQLGLYLRSLEPEQREQVLNNFTRLIELAGKRNIALNAYEELRKNPGKSTLYYAALQADRQKKTEEYREFVALSLLRTAQSSRALINSLPIITNPFTKARVRDKIKELQKQESKIRKDKFADMTIEQMRTLDYDAMSEPEKVAYDTALTYKKNREIRDNIRYRVNDTLENNPSGVYSIESLFKGMSKDKQGEVAIAATTKQVEDTLKATGANATVTNIGVTFDRKTNKLVAIASYILEGDSNNVYTYVIPVEEVAVLKDSEAGLKEIMADDISAKKTARIAKGETDNSALEERQQQLEDLLQQEMDAAHPTVNQANKLVTNVEVEPVVVNGQTLLAPTGRGFIISDKRYENTFTYILDAVNYSRDGEVSSITLFDVETQEFKTFRKRKEGEVEIVDAVYSKILEALAFIEFTGRPGARPQEEQKTEEEITDTFIKLAKETVESSPYSVDVRNETTEVLRSQLLDLQNHIRNLNGRLDRVYSAYAAEGKTLQEANNDNKAKELRQLIAALTKVANDRRSQILDRKEKLELSVKTLTDKIEELQTEVDQLTINKDEVQKQIDNTREVLESGVYNPTENMDDAREVAKAQKFIEQANQVIAYLSRKIEDRTKQINQYNDEIDILLGRRKISAETSEAAAAGQIAEGESLRTGEASEDTGLDAVNTSHDKIVERQKEELEGQNQASNGSSVDQAGGQVNTTSNPSMPSTGNAAVDNSNAITIESGTDLDLDIQLVKGEYEVNDETYNVIAEVNPDGTVTVKPNDIRRDSRIIVNEEGKRTGVVIEDNRKLLSNPAMFPPGTEIVFEVREDTEFWQSDSAKAKANLPEDRHWEQVPIFVKAVIRKTDASGKEVISTEYISLLSAYNPNSPDGYKGNARKIIYEAYKKGGKVTSTIKNKEFSTGAKGNIINLRTNKGEVVFVNPVSEDGIGYKFVNGVPTQTTPTVAIAVGMETLDEEGNPTEVSRKFELGNTKGLTPEEISKMADSLNTALSFYKELTDAGIAVFVIQDPRGNYRAIPAVTRKLTKVAQKQALSALGNRDLVTFNEIVGTNKVRAVTENFLEVESVDKNWGATADAPGIRVTFYSASAKSLVSVQYDTLLQAIAEQEQTGKSELPFSFTVIEQTPEGGKNFKSASRPKEEFGTLKGTIVSDFLSVLANKRFQVDKALLQTNDPYVSKVTGNQYPSYTDYLFSDTEATEPRESGVGSNAILATNVANNNYGSAFFDIGLSFTDIKVDGVGVEIKEEMRARQFEEPVSAPPASTSSVTSTISLSLPTLPGMPPIQSNPSNAPAPAPTPAPKAAEVKTVPLNVATGKISPERVQEIMNDLDAGNTLIFDYQGEELDFARAFLRKQLEERIENIPPSDTTGMTREQLGLEEAPRTIRIKGVMYLASEVNAKMLQGLGITGEEANDILNSICN